MDPKLLAVVTDFFDLIIVPLVKKLAEKKLFYTGIPNNLFAKVERGSSIEFLGNIPGYHTSKRDSIVPLDNLTPKAQEEIDEKSFLEKYLEKKYGIFWVGFPWLARKVDIKLFWKDYLKKKKDASETQNDNPEKSLVYRDREEEVPFARFKETYPFVLPDLETREGNIRIKGALNADMEIVNPYKAFIAPGNFYRNTDAAFLSGLSPWVASRTPEELALEDKESADSPFQKIVRNLNSKTGTNSIEEEYGVRVTNVKWTGHELTEESIKVRNASNLVYIAERKSKAKEIDVAREAATIRELAAAKADKDILEGTAEAKVIVLKGDAESDALQKKGKAFQDNPNLTEVEKMRHLGSKARVISLGGQGVPIIVNEPAPARKSTTEKKP